MFDQHMTKTQGKRSVTGTSMNDLHCLLSTVQRVMYLDYLCRPNTQREVYSTAVMPLHVIIGLWWPYCICSTARRYLRRDCALVQYCLLERPKVLIAHSKAMAGTVRSVMFNVETELDVANGARGTVFQVLLHEDEVISANERRVRLQHMPCCILIKLDRTRVPTLPGLPPGVVPFVPTTKSVHISVEGRLGRIQRTVHRTQFAITLAYVLTDYRS